MKGDYTPARCTLFQVVDQTHFRLRHRLHRRLADPLRSTGRVRIRSAIYSPPTLTLAAQASLVELAVTVRDPQDQAVAGLRREDFELFDRGERQSITVFDPHTSAKLTAAHSDPPPLALFLD